MPTPAFLLTSTNLPLHNITLTQLCFPQARMESVPGTAPEPAWTKNLLWPSSPPFYIRWITIANTRFSRVGHLKNALNENLAVLVGRDGQEIEQNCGAALCELIDEESRRVH